MNEQVYPPLEMLLKIHSKRTGKGREAITSLNFLYKSAGEGWAGKANNEVKRWPLGSSWASFKPPSGREPPGIQRGLEEIQRNYGILRNSISNPAGIIVKRGLSSILERASLFWSRPEDVSITKYQFYFIPFEMHDLTRHDLCCFMLEELLVLAAQNVLNT